MAKKKERKARLSARKAAEKSGDLDFTALSIPSGVQMFQLKAAGTKRIEIIPYTVGQGNPEADPDTEWYERTFWVHRGIGPNNSSYVCPAKTAGKRCPICEARAKMAKDPDSDEEVVKALAPKQRQLWNVFDHAEPTKGVQLWEVSFHNFGKQLYAEIKNSDDDDGYEFFADPEEGMTLRLGIAEKSFAGSKFYEAETINFKPRKETLDPEIFESAICLDDCVKMLSYDELRKIYLQEDDDEDDDDDEEPPTKKKTQKKNPAKKLPTADDFGLSVGDPVEYEGTEYTIVHVSKDGTSLRLEDEDGELVRAISPSDVELVESSYDEDEEDEKPKKKKPVKKKRKPVEEDEDEKEDDEDEDEDDEDEDEDEKPVKKKRKPVKKKKAVEEDDEEDEDEEEEEKPRKRKKKDDWEDWD